MRHSDRMNTARRDQYRLGVGIRYAERVAPANEVGVLELRDARTGELLESRTFPGADRA